MLLEELPAELSAGSAGIVVSGASPGPSSTELPSGAISSFVSSGTTAVVGVVLAGAEGVSAEAGDACVVLEAGVAVVLGSSAESSDEEHEAAISSTAIAAANKAVASTRRRGLRVWREALVMVFVPSGEVLSGLMLLLTFLSPGKFPKFKQKFSTQIFRRGEAP